MFVLHIALQGCLRARDVEYGVTADTGGHIRYLLDLVSFSAADPAIDRIEIVTRAFAGGPHDPCYKQRYERVDAKTRIVRLRGDDAGYLPKEALWTQHDSLAAALIAHVEALDRRPDVIHAHYADAGALAARVRDALGIPYVFTAHSLGRVKRAAFGKDHPAVADLDRRIAIEDGAIAGAAAIIASSRDEAELQYGLHEGCDPGRVRVIPPGSDMRAFADAARDPAVEARIDRFLDDPAKPAILAIARPVTKKNLAGLVEAYGRSPALQAAANLVIVAGTREDLRRLEPEVRDNLAEMLALIDRHDLYGKVAYPKQHRPSEVPAIYAYARAKRGVFANPALSEPFGLTLLEAAASGLPVVATASGGPNDIVETCGNGVLVDPREDGALAAALLAMLSDGAAWDRHSTAGRDAVGRYDWTAHVSAYVALLRGIVAAPAAAAEAPVIARPATARLLVSDIDGTLLGCGESLAAFGRWYGEGRDLAFAVATGRSFHSAMTVLSQHGAPPPAVVIASVGSEIYVRRADGLYRRDDAWSRIIAVGWDREAIAALVAAEGGVTPQSPLEQRRFKLSYMIGGDAQAADRVRALAAAHDLPCTIIQSHGRYLDVLPYAASKGTAVEHVRRALGLSPEQVIAAGDSGNDVEMLRSVPNAIIVGNHTDRIAQRADLSGCYVASGRYARGIIEGVEHFRRAATPA